MSVAHVQVTGSGAVAVEAGYVGVRVSAGGPVAYDAPGVLGVAIDARPGFGADRAFDAVNLQGGRVGLARPDSRIGAVDGNEEYQHP